MPSPGHKSMRTEHFQMQRDTAPAAPSRRLAQWAQVLLRRHLPPGAKKVFVLHDVEGYTHEEIANELGITAGGSKSQLFKARAKLRRLLAPLVDVPDAGPSGRSYATPRY